MKILRGAAVVILCATSIVYGQKPDLRFKNISVLDGLSNSNVKAIVQDYQGYMWFGTPDGLNKYNGYEITVYKHDPGDSLSLPHNDIIHLFEDSRNDLWALTLKGIARFRRDTDDFRVYDETGSNYIPKIHEDGNRNLWVIYNQFLLLLDRDQDKFVKYDTIPSEEPLEFIYQDSRGDYWITTPEHVYTYNPSNRQFVLQPQFDIGSVRTIHEDRKQRLWFASIEKGLILYDRDNKEIIAYQHEENNPNSLPRNPLHGLTEDQQGRLWLGVMNGGLSVFDVDKGEFYNYASDKGDKESLTFNSIHYLFRDNNNHIWLGIFNGGVDFVEERKFTYYGASLTNPNSLCDNNVAVLFQDSRGKIWIGTDGGGLDILDLETNQFKHYQHDPDDPGSLSTNVILSVEEDSNGEIWLGHWEGGMDRYDRENDRFIHYKYSDHSHSSDWRDECIRHIYEDKQGNLWIANSNELNLFDRKTEQYIRYNIPNGGQQNYVSQVLEDHEGNLWVASWDGLHLLDRETRQFTSVGNQEKENGGLSDSKIYALFEDSQHRLWVATSGGLNLLHKETRTFSAYGIKDGLPSESIYSIQEDDNGNLWLGTSKGLSKFNPKKETFRNYDISDGLQGNEFKTYSSLKLTTGELMFGGQNGINLFDPEKITDNRHIPPVVFTDFKIFNKSAPIGEDSPLKKHISQTKALELPYSNAVITIEFAALNYLAPEKNQYKYIMEGFDREWSVPGSKRAATYTNLDPGTYVFRVKASNNDGIWNERGAALTITIIPPFYMTWWFKILTGLALAVIIGYIYKNNAIKQQRKKLEKLVKERTENLQTANDEINALYREIKDSIRAAEVIQRSILPPESSIRKIFPQSFIYHKPKDVIGGDFYWLDRVQNKVIIAVADCTGHGVSGALMAINGHHLLNQAIYANKSLSASCILNRLNKEIIQDLNQSSEFTERSGMDISLCIIDQGKNQLEFAGANHPLYLVRNKELIQIDPDKFSLGLSITGAVDEFSSRIVQLEQNDMLYLFTDGYADQLGGLGEGKKFMYPRFRRLLVQMSEEKLSRQAEILDQNLTSWKGEFEQLDDILIMGLRC